MFFSTFPGAIHLSGCENSQRRHGFDHKQTTVILRDCPRNTGGCMTFGLV